MKTAQTQLIGFTSRSLARCVPYLSSAALLVVALQSTAAYSQLRLDRSVIAAPTATTQTLSGTAPTTTTSTTTSTQLNTQYSVSTATADQITSYSGTSVPIDTSTNTTITSTLMNATTAASTGSGTTSGTTTTQSTLSAQQQAIQAASVDGARRAPSGGRRSTMWSN